MFIFDMRTAVRYGTLYHIGVETAPRISMARFFSTLGASGFSRPDLVIVAEQHGIVRKAFGARRGATALAVMLAEDLRTRFVKVVYRWGGSGGGGGGGVAAGAGAGGLESVVATQSQSSEYQLIPSCVLRCI